MAGVRERELGFELFVKQLGCVLEWSNDIAAPHLLNIEIFSQNVTASGGGSVV